MGSRPVDILDEVQANGTEKPIRLGIVGLSAKPGAWYVLAHLPYISQSRRYKIVALCNSSVESARAAIAAHNLDPSTKAWSTYDELAADPDVDLVVVSTRADTHFEVAMPALNRKKDVFVEWPLAATTQEAEQMATMVRESGVKTIVGFQGRASPTILKIKELVDSGALGDIHSVNYSGAINNWLDGTIDERYFHFIDRTAGANILTIYGGHVLDAIFFSIGPLKQGSYQARAFNLRPEMPGKESAKMHKKDTPDQVLLQGTIDRHPPAVLSLHLRAGPRSIGEPGSTWKIFGTKAELVVDFTSAGPQMAKATGMRLSDFASQTVTTIVPEEGIFADLPKQGQNLGRLYEGFARGGEVPGFEDGVKIHRLLDEFWGSMETVGVD